MSHPQDLSLREQAAAVASGELDAAELLDATFARIEERDGALNSVVVRFPDEARQMLVGRTTRPAVRRSGRRQGHVPAALVRAHATARRARRRRRASRPCTGGCATRAP